MSSIRALVPLETSIEDLQYDVRKYRRFNEDQTKLIISADPLRFQGNQALEG
jgi:hypothetical protein